MNLLVMNEQHFKALSDAQRGEAFLDSKIWTYHLSILLLLVGNFEIPIN